MSISTEFVCANQDVVGRILAALESRIGPRKYRAWFKHGTQLVLAPDAVKLAVPNPFVANWIENHFLDDVAEVVRAELHDCPPVHVIVDPDLSGDLRRRQLDAQADMVHRAGNGQASRGETPVAQALRHRMDDFIVGECNKLAYSAALAVTGEGRAHFNPLFVHGSCGVGKTHLLQGICSNASRQRRGNRPLRWRYVTAETFTNEFVSALRRKKLEEFRMQYRRLDLLAIDDVHFLANKKAIQEEFLHTFNAIEGQGRQIVLASDAHPRLVGDLNDQLVSRFVAGMLVKIDPPDYDTRLRILQMRAKAMKLRTDTGVLEYVATHLRSSVRELEGALIKLMALSALENQRVSMAIVTDALSDQLARTDGGVTLPDIESAVTAYFGVTPADIHSSRRTRTISAARMVTMYLARRHTQMSFPEIGRHMGKNHSSVVLGAQRMEKLLAESGDLKWSTPAGAKSVPAEEVVQLLTEQFA